LGRRVIGSTPAIPSQRLGISLLILAIASGTQKDLPYTAWQGAARNPLTPLELIMGIAGAIARNGPCYVPRASVAHRLGNRPEEGQESGKEQYQCRCRGIRAGYQPRTPAGVTPPPHDTINFNR